MQLSAPALIMSVRPHGEHGAVVRALCAEAGLLPGYVRGARSRALRPVLLPANLVQAEWRARTGEQLPALTVELIESRAALHGEPLPAAALEWLTALTAAALPEGQPYPALHALLSAVLSAIAAAPAARDWAAAIVRYELALLAELGFGLDLGACVATGVTEDLCWVSPKSGAAVSAAAGAGYADRLLPLPAFIRDGGGASLEAVLAGLRLSGHFLARDVLTGRAATVIAARERLVERLVAAA
ncbi:DNA repair protein RecO [Sphingomonas sp.]|uniref:DNA repair protein RecO n=1 Tax=Sphingomonas sp. TaxID=28214 RepID=UPI001D94F873|nr:DNA repair protein RecO [Sphingomonas sp.]MBX9796650.1 DNA repair protein RecO [Sphingomonas sp.]